MSRLDPVVPGQCVLCRVIRDFEAGEGGAPGLDLQTSGRVYHFVPLNPVVDGHRIFIGRHHSTDVTGESSVSLGWLMGAASRYGYEQGEDFNLVTSVGSCATQTVPHTHLHYVPRRPADGLHLPWTGQHEGVER